jgi:hypothetical protein
MKPGGRKMKVAYHETGHAVIARVLGVEVAYVTTFPTGNNTAVTHARSLGYEARDKGVAAFVAGLEADAVVALAGLAADERRKRTTATSRKDYEDDIQRAQAYVGLAVRASQEGAVPHVEYFDTPGNIDRHRLWDETVALVDANWPAIERVAAELLARTVLVQEDIDRLIGTTGQAHPRP